MGVPGDEDPSLFHFKVIHPHAVAMGDDGISSKKPGPIDKRREGDVSIFIEAVRVAPYSLDTGETVVVGIWTEVSCREDPSCFKMAFCLSEAMHGITVSMDI